MWYYQIKVINPRDYEDDLWQARKVGISPIIFDNDLFMLKEWDLIETIVSVFVFYDFPVIHFSLIVYLILSRFGFQDYMEELNHLCYMIFG